MYLESLFGEKNVYQDISMSERLDRIGELLAKGVYLHMKKEKEAKQAKEEKKNDLTLLPELSSVDDKNK